MATWKRAPGGEGPLVIGHRGASARAPENSVEAFARARADGADGVELDVLGCATGEVVVFHDDDLARLGGRSDRIDALPFSDVRAARLVGGARIPTLEEAFEACGPELLVNVELKAPRVGGGRLAALVDGVAAILGRTRWDRASSCRPSARAPCAGGCGARPRSPRRCSSSAQRPRP
jgi:glycerophosphoryl diester phosphodiesterase